MHALDHIRTLYNAKTAIVQKIDPLDLLYDRCCTLADRVAAGELGFLDAIDIAWSAAEFAGTVDRAGPDAVQAALVAAFVGVPRGPT